MDLDSFKEVYGKKTSLQKLDILLEQIDIDGSDNRDYAESKYGRRNEEETEYWRKESIAMLERINWLCLEIKNDLQKKDETISKMYEILDETCQDVRERTGEEYVCGLISARDLNLMRLGKCAAQNCYQNNMRIIDEFAGEENS